MVVFSPLSEQFTGGSRRERRPLSLVFVASWRAAFKPAALPLLLYRKVKTKHLGRGVRAGVGQEGAFNILSAHSQVQCRAKG